jgi:hypothetical protein
MRKATVLGVLALAGTLASPAFADEYTGFRLGIVMGEDKLEGAFAYDPVGSQSINTERFGYGLSGGWALNKWLAIEGTLRGGGEFNQKVFPAFTQSLSVLPDIATCACEDQPAVFNVRNDVIGVDVSVVGTFWIGNKFAIFGRAGFYGWQAETTYTYGDRDNPPLVSDQADDAGFSPLAGIGLQTVLDGALVRIEYVRTEPEDLTIGSNFAQTHNLISSINFSIVWNL